jgi:6-phosphogluconolactonase/glucosamine-6-phosphate isomerase/deaminase
LRFDFIAFADERLVPEDSEDSNLGTFLRNLNKSRPPNLIQVVNKNGELVKDYKITLSEIISNPNNKCFAITGFGTDGHFWSLFSKEDCENSSIVLNSYNKNHKHKRVTLGIEALKFIETNFIIGTTEKFNSIQNCIGWKPILALNLKKDNIYFL